MTTLPDSQPVEPTKKPDSEIHPRHYCSRGTYSLHSSVDNFLCRFKRARRFKILARNAPGIGPAGGTNAMTPAAMEMPIAEIATKSVICQVTGMLSISGTVKNNANHPLSVEMVGPVTIVMMSKQVPDMIPSLSIFMAPVPL